MKINVTGGTATDFDGNKHEVKVLELSFEEGKAGFTVFLDPEEARRCGDALHGKALETPVNANGSGLYVAGPGITPPAPPAT